MLCTVNLDITIEVSQIEFVFVFLLINKADFKNIWCINITIWLIKPDLSNGDSYVGKEKNLYLQLIDQLKTIEVLKIYLWMAVGILVPVTYLGQNDIEFRYSLI